MLSLCDLWEFSPIWSEDFLNGKTEAQSVRLPHTVKEIPPHYADPSAYTEVCGYRCKLPIEKELEGKRLFLQFDGAAHIADVYVNGKHCCQHRCGYTMFRVEITELVKYGEENALAVKLDSTENPSIPPFGFVVDYLAFGGLYREVWLDVREKSYISDLYVTTPWLHTLKASVSVDGTADRIRLSLLDGERTLVSKVEKGEFTLSVPEAEAWSPENPKLYTCRAELLNEHGEVIDEKSCNVGFRTAEFRKDGFYLNGEKSFLRGLNRHQSYPYIGYAAPERLQREDARILKHELSCTAVRTSHYPQSQHFIDECDRLGLMVFTEIPGWQHVGDEAWRLQAIENTREMVMQYRSHPSIVLWGVRINESQDYDDFYSRTNALAHELDPSRPTSGVRYLEKSSLLEDVYAFNDFSHTGDNAGAKKRKNVSSDMEKGYLISEHNGHMFPTKSYDTWQKRQEHALRHGRVLEAAMSSGEHAGCFGWCMFDYTTHRDFGSGDRICYHGVMDSFRNPKLAAALYASQGDETPVLEVGSTMDIGDYPGGQRGKVYVFTNADEVALYKNDVYVTSFTKHELDGLRHGPILIDDLIGELLHTQEGYSGRKEKLVHTALDALAKHGNNMTLSDKLKMGRCMLECGLSYEDGYALYGKYVANWGGRSTSWRFDGIKDGRVIASRTCSPGSSLHLEVKAGSEKLCETSGYDMTAVRVRILDNNSNVASYAQLPLHFEVNGAVDLVGPGTVCAEGGMSGCYIRTAGTSGHGSLTVSADGLEAVMLEFEVEK